MDLYRMKGMYLDTPSTIGIKKHEDVIKLQASLLAEHETSWASIVRKNLLKVEEEQKKEVLQGEDSTTTLPTLIKAGARTVIFSSSCSVSPSCLKFRP